MKRNSPPGGESPAAVRVEYVKLNPGAHAPERMSPGAAGFDLRACLESDVVLPPGRIGLIPTGLSVAVPRGYEGQVRARSGLALKHGLAVANAPGTIDSDYRGEVRVILVNLGPEPFTVSSGDRIAQLVISPVAEAVFEPVQQLPSTPRGEGGFGHTGRT